MLCISLLLGGCIDFPNGPDGNARPYPPLNSTPFDRDLPAESELTTVLQTGDTVYFFGGMRADGRAVDSVWAYDLGDRRWIARRPMPTPRYYAGAAAAGGYIYVIGGRDRAATAEASDRLQRTVERYDPSTDSWTTLPRVTLGDFDASYPTYVASARGKLYTISSLRTTRRAVLFESTDGTTWTPHSLNLDAGLEPTLMSDGDDLFVISSEAVYFAQSFYRIDPATYDFELDAPPYDWVRGNANRWTLLDGYIYNLNGVSSERDVIATYDSKGTAWAFNDVPYDITSNRHFVPIVTDRGRGHLYLCAPPQLRIGVHYAVTENRFFVD